MGSQHLYRAYAEVLRGTSALDQADLDAMNLRITTAAYVINTSGYGENFGQICLPADISAILLALLTPLQALAYATNVNCVPSEIHSANTNSSLISKPTLSKPIPIPISIYQSQRFFRIYCFHDFLE
jgi:hypothetical protein